MAAERRRRPEAEQEPGRGRDRGWARGRGRAAMSEPELLLDSNIRLWVVLPIVFITFFVGMIRHYVSILLQSDKRLTQEQVSDRSGQGRGRGKGRAGPGPPLPPSLTTALSCSQVLIRSRVLRENGKYIPKQVRGGQGQHLGLAAFGARPLPNAAQSKSWESGGGNSSAGFTGTGTGRTGALHSAKRSLFDVDSF